MGGGGARGAQNKVVHSAVVSARQMGRRSGTDHLVFRKRHLITVDPRLYYTV